MNMPELIKSEVQRYLNMKLELQDYGQLKENILSQAPITEMLRRIETILVDEKETNAQKSIGQLQINYLQKQATQDATTQEQLRLEKLNLESRLPSTRQQLLTLEQQLNYAQSLMMESELNLNSKKGEIYSLNRRIRELESQVHNLEPQLYLTPEPVVYSQNLYPTVVSEYNGAITPYSHGMVTPAPSPNYSYLYWQKQQIQAQLIQLKSNRSTLQRDYDNFERDYMAHQRMVNSLGSNIHSLKSDVSRMEHRLPEIAGILQQIESRRQLDTMFFSLNRLSCKNQNAYQQQVNKVEREAEAFYQSQLTEAEENSYECFIEQLKLTALPMSSNLPRIIEQMTYHQSDLTDLKNQKQNLEQLNTQLKSDEVTLVARQKEVLDNQLSLGKLAKEIEDLTQRKPELKTEAAKLLATADSQKYIAQGIAGATVIFATSSAFMLFVLSAPVHVIVTLSVTCLLSCITSGVFVGMRWYNQSKSKGCEEQIVKNEEAIESYIQRCAQLNAFNKELNDITIPKLKSDINTLKETSIPEQEAIVENAEQKAALSYQLAAAMPHSQFMETKEMLILDDMDTKAMSNESGWTLAPASTPSTVAANLTQFGHFSPLPSAPPAEHYPLSDLSQEYYTQV